jgi:hypothetical protein
VLDWLEKMLDVVVESLSVPLKVGLFFLNMLFVLFCLFTIRFYGYYPVLGILLAEAPIAYIVLKEIWRQVHMLPKMDGFELSSERMDSAIGDYVRMVKRRKRKHP